MFKIYFETIKDWVGAMEVHKKNLSAYKIYAGIDKKGYYLKYIYSQN